MKVVRVGENTAPKDPIYLAPKIARALLHLRARCWRRFLLGGFGCDECRDVKFVALHLDEWLKRMCWDDGREWGQKSR